MFLKQSTTITISLGPFVSATDGKNGARLALYRRGIRVPEDISLVGFDDQPHSAYQTPPLTSVGWPAIEIGEAAAQALLSRLKDKPYQIPVFQPRLYVRESVARAR